MRKEFIFIKIKNKKRKQKNSVGRCVCVSLTLPTPVDAESHHTELLPLCGRFGCLEEGEIRKANGAKGEFIYALKDLE